MKKVSIIIIITLFTKLLCGCSESPNNTAVFNVVGNNVTIWEDSAGAKSIVLVSEVSNLTNNSLYFKESDFDIVDQNGNFIDTIQSVNAYPPIINPDETAVYYGAKVSEKITDPNLKLTAIPHIVAEKAKDKRKEIGINGITGDGNGFLTGIITNPSSKIDYKNIQIAIICRTQNNEAVSVMATEIDTLKPREQMEFKVVDTIGRELDSNITISTLQNFAYVLPEDAISGIGEKQGEEIMRDIITLLLIILIIGGAICFQIFLSKKSKKWPGLILPVLSLIISVIAILPLLQEIILPQTEHKYDEYGNLLSSITIQPSGDIFFAIFISFFVYNISTLIFIFIYWICRIRRK